MEIVLRRVRHDDMPTIVRISSDIWDGSDYVPAIAQDWINDEKGIFIAAEVEGLLRGFGKLTLQGPDCGWCEGLRVDSHFRGKGTARAIAIALIETARSAGLRTLRFATSVDNIESIHLNESLGFRRISGFRYLSIEGLREMEEAQARAASLAGGVQAVQVSARREADCAALIARIAGSSFVAKAGAMLPWGFMFEPATRGSISTSIAEGALFAAGGDRAHPEALLLLQPSHEAPRNDPNPTQLCIRFMEGSGCAGLAALSAGIRHAMEHGARGIEASVPVDPELTRLLHEGGFKDWWEELAPSAPTVLLYDYPQEMLRNESGSDAPVVQTSCM